MYTFQIEANQALAKWDEIGKNGKKQT